MMGTILFGRGLARLAPVAIAATLALPAALPAQVVITGNDNKALLVDGKLTIDPNGVQSVSIIDIGAYGPKLRATVEVPNSIFGPPTNLAITPDEKLALVAEAVHLDPGASPPKFVPSDVVHVIDLEASPPRIVDSVRVGMQPSGMAIHPSGRLAIVANRAETSVSVLSIRGKTVRFEGKVDTGEGVTHVVFTPDGKRALVNKFTSHKVSFLAIDGMTVTYTGPDLPVGQFPYNSDITPDGKLALVANTGNRGRSDGNEDSISVIDLEADPPRVIDWLPAGDAPEGIAISPDGKLAATGNLGGSDAVPGAFYLHERGRIVLFKIEGKKVTRLKDIQLGRVPEALAFSPDGKYLLVGNLLDADVSVLRVRGTEVTDTGKNLPLPGNPGSMAATAR